MDTYLPRQVSTAPSVGQSLGKVVDEICAVKPYISIDFPYSVVIIRTCGDGAIVGLRDGKVVLITVSPTPMSYLLSSDNPHTASVSALAVSSDYQMAMTGTDDGELKLWSVAEKRESATLEGHTKVSAVAITQDCRLGISGGDPPTIKVWDLGNGTERATLEGHNSKIICLTTTKDSKRCISGDFDGVIKIWALETMQETTTLSGHSECVTCLALSPDENTLWSGAYDKTIRVWSLIKDLSNRKEKDRQEFATFTGHTDYITHLRLIREGKVCISISNDGTVKLWSLPEKKEIGTLRVIEKHISGFATLNNERFCLIVSTDSMVVKLWDLESCTEVISFAGHTGQILSVALTQDEQHFLTGSNDATMKIWSLARESEDRELRFPETNSTMEVTENLVIVPSDYDIRVWSIEDNKELAVIQCDFDICRCVTVTDDHRYLLLSSDDYSIKLWDLATTTELFTFTGHTKKVVCFACTPDSQFFLSSGWDSLKLWNLADKYLVKSLNIDCGINDMVVAPDGQHLISIHGKGGIIEIWSLPGLTLLVELSGHVGVGTGIDITEDGKTLASCGSDKTVRLWSFEERRLLATLYGHSDSVCTVKLSRDARYAISASDDKTAIVWSLKEKREVARFSGHTDKLRNVSFTTDSKSVITTSWDRTVRISPFQMPWEFNDKTELEVTSDLVVVVQTLREGKHLNQIAAKMSLSSYNVNSLHISAFNNYADRCSEYLEMGVPFLKGTFGSPLTVSLERKTIKCTDVFLQYLISLSEKLQHDNEWPTYVCITDDIPALLRCGSGLLQPFFHILMQTPASPPLPHFITPTSPLPIVQFSDSRLINIPDFDQSQNEQLGSDLVTFTVGLIRQNTAPGSAQSLELIAALQDCEDKTVLTSPYLTLLIENKWEYFYYYTLTLTILYAVMLASLVMILFQSWNPVPLSCIFLTINGFFILYELAQALTSSSSYWLNPWNYIDTFRGFLCMFWGVLILLDQKLAFLGEDYQKNVRLVVSLLCFLRGFTYFRSFRMTRLFVYLTLAVVKEMYSFLIIMAYSVFSFGVCTSILLGHTTIGVSWASAFSLILGDFDSSTFGALEWGVFMCAALINVIIMLNLLVSILGDAYEKTQMSVRENDLYLMLGLISEYESLLYWRRNTSTPTVMFVCASAQIEENVQEWAGLAMDVKNAMKQENTEIKQQLKELGTKNAEIKQQLGTENAEIKRELKELGGKVNQENVEMKQQLKKLEDKMDAILARLPTV